MANSNSKLSLILKGAAMGVAEIIPGVSGGTIAFITGIYKELIDTIKAFDLNAIQLLFSGQFKPFADKVNLGFLFRLLLGMVMGIVFGVFVVAHLLETFPEVLWGFFFGLILASIPMMMSNVKDKNVKVFMAFIISAVIAFAITSLSPAEANTSYLYIYLSGLIAIVALVLPGISGSFILLLLGMYTFIVPTIKSFLSGPSTDNIIILTVFGLGCLTGLLFFVRIISKAFNNYFNITVAAMSGFMLGSLNKIWPWRNINSYLDKDTGVISEVIPTDFDSHQESIKIISETNVWPTGYYQEPLTIFVLLACVVGIALVYGINKLNNNKI